MQQNQSPSPAPQAIEKIVHAKDAQDPQRAQRKLSSFLLRALGGPWRSWRERYDKKYFTIFTIKLNKTTTTGLKNKNKANLKNELKDSNKLLK